MKRILIKIIVLVLVFAGSLAAFISFMDIGKSINIKEIAEPSLPVMTMSCEGAEINKLYGYKDEMDISTFRESITLLPYDRNLSFSITNSGADISGVSYFVYSLSDNSLLENGRIKSFDTNGSVMTSSLHINNPVTMGQEYMLKFNISLSGGDSYYYYTRLLQRNGQNLTWYLDFTNAFYQNCINKTVTDAMLSQLEPDSAQSNSSLHSVNIHSDIEQITWGNLTPSLVKKAVPTILEINETTVSVGLEYIISSSDGTGGLEYYLVNEYYRMRRDQDKVILLDFERTCNQYFDGKLQVLTDTGIDIGIAGKDITYMTNEDTDVLVFAQNGELWEYNRTANKTSRIFTFHTSTHSDDRTEHNGYDIKISNINNEGDVTFVVYGYMNTGTHEGCSGISFYKYRQEDNTTEELLFIPSDQSFDMLRRNVSRLAYINEDERCFLCYGDSIISITIDTQDVYVVQGGLDWDSFAVSDSQGLVAWTDSSDNGYSVINELNLNTGETLEIKAPEDEQIIIQQFLGEDLVYGLMKDDSTFTDQTGSVYYPMYRVCLISSSGEIIKNYQIDDVYVYGITRGDSSLTLQRFMYQDGGRVPISDDTIVYYGALKDETVSIKLTVNERKGTLVSFVFTVAGESSNLLTLYARYMQEEPAPIISLDNPASEDNVYYVYAKGHLYGIYTEINKAIVDANSQVGIVLGSDSNYLWERGNYKTANVLDPAVLPKGLLSAPLDEDELLEALGDGYTVWNLSGCSLESLKYQLSNGYPVIGKWSDSQSVLILGYDQYENIWYYDQATNSAAAVAFEEAEAAFEAQGNIFMSYHA